MNRFGEGGGIIYVSISQNSYNVFTRVFRGILYALRKRILASDYFCRFGGMELLSYVLGLIGIILSLIGAWILYKNNTKSIDKINWDYRDVLIEAQATIPYPSQDEIQKKRVEKLNEAIQLLNKSISKNISENKERQSKSKTGIDITLLGILMQLASILSQLIHLVQSEICA